MHMHFTKTKWLFVIYLNRMWKILVRTRARYDILEKLTDIFTSYEKPTHIKDSQLLYHVLKRPDVIESVIQCINFIMVNQFIFHIITLYDTIWDTTAYTIWIVNFIERMKFKNGKNQPFLQQNLPKFCSIHGKKGLKTCFFLTTTQH